MAIEVKCPNGHKLLIKDKYAGKSGACPHCKSRVEVPDVLTDDHVLDMIGDWQPPAVPTSPTFDGNDGDSASVLDDEPRTQVRPESGMSLLGSSIIRHKKVCANCGAMAELQYASCPKCNKYFDD